MTRSDLDPLNQARDMCGCFSKWLHGKLVPPQSSLRGQKIPLNRSLSATSVLRTPGMLQSTNLHYIPSSQAKSSIQPI